MPPGISGTHAFASVSVPHRFQKMLGFVEVLFGSFCPLPHSESRFQDFSKHISLFLLAKGHGLLGKTTCSIPGYPFRQGLIGSTHQPYNVVASVGKVAPTIVMTAIALARANGISQWPSNDP